MTRIDRLIVPRGTYRRARRARPFHAVVAMLAMIAGGVVSPADAVAVSTLEVSAAADLPRYPCFIQSGPCRAELAGEASGTLVGRLSDGSWSVSLLDARLEGAFDYINGSDCSTGAAGGALTVRADPTGLVDGVLTSGDQPPRRVVGLRLRADFTWQQAGASAGLFLANATVELNVASEGWTAVARGLKGAGTTTYVPDTGGADPFECSWLFTTNPPPARVVVAGILGVTGA